MDEGGSEGDIDGITTMKAIHEPLLAYTSPYGQEEPNKETREWSDEPSDYYEHLSASPFRPGVYDDVSSEDCDNDTGIGLAYASPMAPTAIEEEEEEDACPEPERLRDDGDKRPFERRLELFAEDSVPMQDSEDELQRSLRESVSRHRLLAMKMPGEEYYDDEELKRSLMESVKRHSMLSRRRSLGLEERNETKEEEVSSSSEEEEEEEGSSHCSYLEEAEKESKLNADTGEGDVTGMEGIVEEDCEESVEHEKAASGYSGSIVDSNVDDGPVSGDGDGAGGCGSKGAPVREACCLASATTASPDRISRRLRSRSCAKTSSREKEYWADRAGDGPRNNIPDRKIQGSKRIENGPVGISTLAVNNSNSSSSNDHRKKATVDPRVTLSSSGKMRRTKKGCRAKKAAAAGSNKAPSGLVVRAMLKLKRRDKCCRKKVSRPVSLADQKKKAIRLKLASERKKLLVERRIALERELDTGLLGGGLNAERLERQPSRSSSRGLTPPYACSGVTLGSASLRDAAAPVVEDEDEEDVFRDGVVKDEQGPCRRLKPEALKQLAAKVSRALKEAGSKQPEAVAAVAKEEQEEAKTVVLEEIRPEVFEQERGDEEEEEEQEEEEEVRREVVAACETQRRGPGRRRKRGGKYPVPPRPVRLSRNGKKLGRPRTKNVQEHVEDFVRGATNIAEPFGIYLPHFNHEDQNNDSNCQGGVESLPHDQGAARALPQETHEEVAAEPEDERRFACRAPKSTFRCKEIAVRQHDKFTQILLVSTTKQKNALSVQALSELESVLQSARKDAGCHVVLLSAPTGNTFCSGVDLQGLVSSDGHAAGHRVACQASDALKAFLKTLVSFPKPVVAAVNGEAVGLGVTLLPLCDVVYASDKATFRTLYGRIGQAPEGGATCTMPDLLGPARASELLLTGRKLTATEAFEQGLVSHVLWPNTFMEQVIPRVRHLASQSVQFAETTKALMRCHQRARVEMAIEMECRLLASQWQSKECQNNMRNIIQKNELS